MGLHRQLILYISNNIHSTDRKYFRSDYQNRKYFYSPESDGESGSAGMGSDYDHHGSQDEYWISFKKVELLAFIEDLESITWAQKHF